MFLVLLELRLSVGFVSVYSNEKKSDVIHMGRWRYALAVSSVGEPLQRKVMNPATVEHLFVANNKLPVYYYVCVKQQAQKKETQTRTAKPTHVKKRGI